MADLQDTLKVFIKHMKYDSSKAGHIFVQARKAAGGLSLSDIKSLIGKRDFQIFQTWQNTNSAKASIYAFLRQMYIYNRDW